MQESNTIQATVRRWLEEAVIGLNLCPFASSVYHTGKVKLLTSEAGTAEEAVRETLAEVISLLDTPAQEVSTVLVVFPGALANFEEFLDAAATIEDLLVQAGAEGVLQLATFHPDYLFEGEPKDALSHYTNRAPFPIFHLLREDEVSEAVDTHPDVEGIPAKNIAKLEELGREKLLALWKHFARE